MTIRQWINKCDESFNELNDSLSDKGRESVMRLLDANVPASIANVPIAAEDRKRYIELLFEICAVYKVYRRTSLGTAVHYMRTESQFNSLVPQHDKNDGQGLFQNTDPKFIALRDKVIKANASLPLPEQLIKAAEMELSYWKSVADEMIRNNTAEKALPFSIGIIGNQKVWNAWVGKYKLLTRPTRSDSAVHYTVKSRPITGHGSWSVPEEMWAFVVLLMFANTEIKSAESSDDLDRVLVILRYLPTYRQDPILAGLTHTQAKLMYAKIAKLSNDIAHLGMYVSGVKQVVDFYDRQLPAGSTSETLAAKYFGNSGVNVQHFYMSHKEWPGVPDTFKVKARSQLGVLKFDDARGNWDERRAENRKAYEFLFTNYIAKLPSNLNFEYSESAIAADEKLRRQLAVEMWADYSKAKITPELMSFIVKPINYDRFNTRNIIGPGEYEDVVENTVNLASLLSNCVTLTVPQTGTLAVIKNYSVSYEDEIKIKVVTNDNQKASISLADLVSQVATKLPDSVKSLTGLKSETIDKLKSLITTKVTKDDDENKQSDVTPERLYSFTKFVNSTKKVRIANASD